MTTLLAQNEQLEPTDLQKVNIPVTVALGDSDQMVSEEETNWAVGHLPNSTFKLIKNCPHPLHQVPIEELKKLIIE